MFFIIRSWHYGLQGGYPVGGDELFLKTIAPSSAQLCYDRVELALCKWPIFFVLQALTQAHEDGVKFTAASLTQVSGI